MTQTGTPYIQRCTLCGDGLIRIHQCAACNGVVAVCDECERAWSETTAIFNHDDTPADGAFPVCPECEAEGCIGKPLDKAAIRSLGLGVLIAGESA